MIPQLSASEYQALVEQAPMLIWRANTAAECDYFNDVWLQFRGRTMEQERGNGWAEGVHPNDLERCLKTYRDAFGRLAPFEMEYRLRRHDGIYRWIFDRGVPFFDDGGQFQGYIGSCIDVTPRKEAESLLDDARKRELEHLSELQRRDARIRRLVDANIIGIFMWRLEGEAPEALDAVLYDVNDEFLRMVRYEREDFASGRVRRSNLTPPEWRERTAEAHAELMTTGTCQPYEKEYLRRDGTRVPVLVGTAAFEGGREGVGFVLDRTERKGAEEALREAQMELAHANRVATMGQLMATIAHEVTQPIAAVVFDAQTALRWLEAQPPDLKEVRQALDRVVKAGYRAGDVLRRIRGILKKAPPGKEGVDINEAVREVIELTRLQAVKNGVTVQTDIADGLPLIEGDRVQLQQVLLNLVMNALEAMSGVREGGRELLISTRNAEQGGLLVAVCDSGPGLAPAVAERIFAPFYTTKPTGLGMGLSICHSIIEAHGGRIWVNANLSRGVTFQFTVPATNSAPKKAQSVTSATKAE
jgi:PAS domain S-box-containing protein